jgi:secondary thiamine-phosphate synthase enzyme
MGEVIVNREFEAKTGGCFDALDVTDEVEEVVAASGVREGRALVFSPHTTCCVLLAPSRAAALASLETAREYLAPDGIYYAHDDLSIRTENLVKDELPNAPAHILHVFLGRASVAMPVSGGGIVLGTDQRVLFVELDCSRERRYCVQVLGD